MTVAFDVLKRPLVTEKTTAMKTDGRKVALEVATWANKKQIRDAAQSLFGVSVETVHTALCRGKMKRVGKSMGRRSNWKKAILTLKEGSDLDVFGVVSQAPVPAEQE